MSTLEATFLIEMSSAEGLLPGTGRFDFTKRWDGGLVGRSSGVMLSAGDPASGRAGYVALEVFTGQLGERDGSFALQQFGTMDAGDPVLYYEIVPGSGGGELAGIAGKGTLDVDDAGTHRFTLDYQLD